MKCYDDLERIMTDLSAQLKVVYDFGYERGYHDGQEQEEDLVKSCQESYEQKMVELEIKAEKEEWYLRGLKEAWDVARTITGMGANDLEACGISIIPNYFDDNVHRMFENYSVSEIMEKLKGYKEEHKEKEDGITVGDEIVIVRNADYLNAVVLDIDTDGILWLLDENGCNRTYDPEDTVTTTGRHFDQIGDLLKLLREDET